MERIDHLPPADHPAFYAASLYTLNVTRADMIEAGWSPSVRLFEAAACAVPIISDKWDGIADLFTPGEQIILADDSADVVAALKARSIADAAAMGGAARAKVLAGHTSRHRAAQLEGYIRDAARVGAHELTAA